MVRPVWFLVVLAACGARPSPPSGELTTGSWWELRSPRFVLRTDLDRKEAAARLDELESDYRALTEVYELLLEGFAAPRHVTQVVVFASCDGFDSIWPGHRGLVGQSAVDGERMVVLCAYDRSTTPILLHELAHVFNSVFGPIPVWLEEGLAEYLQTLYVDDGKVWVGAVPHSRGTGLPSLSRLLSASYAQFHGSADEARSYIASRNLVGVFLGRSEADQRRFVRYLHLLNAGANRSAAWSQTMAGLPMDKLEDDMLRYDTRPGVMLWWLAHTRAADLGSPTVERVRPGEVQALVILTQLFAVNRPPVRSLDDRVTAGERDDPSWPDGDFWRALIEASGAQPDSERVVTLLRAHLARNPSDERALDLLVRTRQVMVDGKSQTDDAWAEDTASRARLGTLEPDVLALGRVARSWRALNDIAWYFALRHQPEVGLGFARRSLDAEPVCADCKDTLALLLAEAGRLDEAVAAQEEAVQTMGERGLPKAMLERLARFRTLRDRCRAEPGATGCPREVRQTR